MCWMINQEAGWSGQENYFSNRVALEVDVALVVYFLPQYRRNKGMSR